MRSRISIEPNLSIIAAHMLWIDRNAATEGQAMERASNTSTPSSRPSPEPPASSLTKIPPKPSSASRGQSALGIVPSFSH